MIEFPNIKAVLADIKEALATRRLSIAHGLEMDIN
jgi:hypothetical protein